MFRVLPFGSTPAIGSAAPASETPTATTPEEIAAISTDPHPDPDFYTHEHRGGGGVREAGVHRVRHAGLLPDRDVRSDPRLVKGVAADYKDRVDFVHVEPYQLQQTANGLQPLLDADGHPQPVQSVLDYGLQTEPYMFVTDATGHIAAKVEGIAGADELRAALDAVLAGS